MYKKRKIDFILNESEDSKLIFRFYPRQSSCHSFGDEPPKSWEDVYKVYYAYSIFITDKDGGYSRVLYECPCDECSVIDEVANVCKLLSESKKIFKGTSSNGEEYTLKLLDREMMPLGYGTSWTISKKNNLYKFSLWDWDDIGYRFWLNKNKMKEFGEYLLGCCEYMLSHGDPI